MKCTFEEHGDSGLRLESLKDGDDFVFINPGCLGFGRPATIREGRFLYYQRGTLLFNIDSVRGAEKVARIEPSSPVVFVLKNEA